MLCEAAAADTESKLQTLSLLNQSGFSRIIGLGARNTSLFVL